MILLTGGTGFLGRFILQELVNRKLPVRVLSLPNEKFDIEKYPGAEIIEGNVLDYLSISRALEGVTGVIHAAALVSFAKSQTNNILKVNVKGTENMVDACLEKGIDKFVQISSIGAMSIHANDPISESSKWKDHPHAAFYDRTKYLAELEVHRGVQEGLRAVIINPSMILGPGDWNAGTPKIVKTIAKGLPFYPPGATGWVAAVDVAKAAVDSLTSDFYNGERFIVSGANMSYQELFEGFALELKVKPPKMKAPRFLTLVLASINSFFFSIFGKEPGITPETVHASFKSFTVDGSKIVREMGFEYTPISEVQKSTALAYLSQHSR